HPRPGGDGRRPRAGCRHRCRGARPARAARSRAALFLRDGGRRAVRAAARRARGAVPAALDAQGVLAEGDRPGRRRRTGEHRVRIRRRRRDLPALRPRGPSLGIPRAPAARLSSGGRASGALCRVGAVRDMAGNRRRGLLTRRRETPIVSRLNNKTGSPSMTIRQTAAAVALLATLALTACAPPNYNVRAPAPSGLKYVVGGAAAEKSFSVLDE